MKKLVNRILIAGALLIGANAAIASPVSGDYFEAWYQKKFGRPTPQAEARANAEREATAYRATEQHPTRIDWNEVYFRAKLGRPTPQAEARVNAERETTAFREETPKHVATARVNLHEQYMRGKWGRTATGR